ncbi:MAG: transposase [Candidatus Neptunochlamydia sp.]|nr:transposase [Candidatus Neptunochlamydia sp.]
MSLKDFDPFALFIDEYHIAGDVHIIALGMGTMGQKKALGLWQEATENHVVCNQFLSSLEQRGLSLEGEILYITDGGMA